jgi:hypothetical protein
VAGTCGYGERLSGSINAGNFLTSCKVYWLASQEGLCSMEKVSIGLNFLTNEATLLVITGFFLFISAFRSNERSVLGLIGAAVSVAPFEIGRRRMLRV